MKKKLSLQDFAEILVQREDIDRKAADAFVRSFFDIIEQGLQTDKFVKIKGFGTFKLVAVSERESVNINTGERFQISSHTKVSFTPDTTMKELVNRPFAHFEAVDLNDDTDTKEFEVIDEEMEEANEADDDTDIDTEDDDAANEAETTEENNSTSDEQPQVDAPQSEVTNQPPTVENDPNSSAPVDATPIEIITDEDTPTDTEGVATSQPSTTPAPAEEVTTETAQPQNITSPQPQSQPVETPNEPPLQPTAVPQPAAEKKRTRGEDIVVTDPTPISEHAEASTTAPTSTPERTNATMGYTYNEVPTPRKRNWWRIIALTLLVMALMTASYFVGYYRMLCPTCDNYIFGAAPATQPAVPTIPVAKPAPQPTQPAADTTSSRTDSAQVTPRQAPKAEEAPKPNVAPAAEPNKPKQSQATASSAPQRPKTHCVGKGENIYRIARKYYGDDSYAEKIIKANNLKDANTIVVGMELKLP